MNVMELLKDLGLQQYTTAFEENHIDDETLLSLDDADLRELGIKSLGHRKTLLREVARLAAKTAEPVPPAAPQEAQSTAQRSVRHSTEPATLQSSEPATQQGTRQGTQQGTQQQGTEETRQPVKDARERRQVTIMFCDLVGSTALSTQLDAEDMDTVIRRYQESMTPVVREFGGHVARFSGDGILSYFGYPQAIEREAERAIQCALKSVRIMQRAPIVPGIQAQIRIGIATGDVVVGDVIEQGRLYESMVTGETPNLAARLQGAAEPGEVVICHRTRALTNQLFEFADHGELELKGFDAAVRNWKVIAAIQSDNSTRPGRAISPLTGRDREIQLLRDCWREVRDGSGQSILVSGAGGVGKTRLVTTLTEELPLDSLNLQRYGCQVFATNTPYQPLIRTLYQMIGASSEDDSATVLDCLQSFLARQPSVEDEEILPYLANLLGVAQALPATGLGELSAQRLKMLTIEAMVQLAIGQSTDRPLLILFEDVHWADPTSIEFLQALGDAVRDHPILLSMTSRSDTDTSWTAQFASEIALDSIDRLQTSQIIDSIVDGIDIPQSLRQIIAEKSDGIPLYIEELTRNLVEEFKGQKEKLSTQFSLQVGSMSVPQALQSSLIARLDRLGDGKEFALECAVIGREFSRELASLVTGIDVVRIEPLLHQLTEAGIIQASDRQGSAYYVFRHALLRDAAYNNLLRAHRRDIHSKIADTLITFYPQTAAAEPELVAHHFRYAENYSKAIDYLIAAGGKALHSSANLEAIDHLQQGLALLHHISDPAQSMPYELQLQMTLGPALIATRGFAAPEVAAAFNKAREICELSGASEQLFPAIRGLMAFYTVASDLDSVEKLGQPLLQELEQSQSSAGLLEVNWVIGSSKLFSGDIRGAESHFQIANQHYNRQQHAAHAGIFGQDPGVTSLAHNALLLTLAGRYDESREKESRALALAKELGHPFSEAVARAFTLSCLSMRREHHAAIESAQHNIALCTKQVFPIWMANAQMTHALSQAAIGEANWQEEFQAGLGLYQATGAKLSVGQWKQMFAEAHLLAGDTQSGLNLANEALEHMEHYSEYLIKPGALLIKAQLLLKADANQHAATADTLVRDSYATAMRIGSHHQALQAAVAWVKLSGEAELANDEAMAALHGVYKLMDQGHDVKIMQAAAAMG